MLSDLRKFMGYDGLGCSGDGACAQDDAVERVIHRIRNAGTPDCSRRLRRTSLRATLGITMLMGVLDFFQSLLKLKGYASCVDLNTRDALRHFSCVRCMTRRPFRI